MSSRKEQKERLRKERLEREQAAAAATAGRRRLGSGVAGLLVAAVVIALGAIALAGGGKDKNNADRASGTWPGGSIPAQKIKDLDAAVKAAGCTLQNPKSEGRGHTESESTRVTYKSTPPTS